jgi:hypothetical protein
MQYVGRFRVELHIATMHHRTPLTHHVMVLHVRSYRAIIGHDIDSGHSGRDRQSHDSGLLLGEHHRQTDHGQQLVSHAQPSGRHADTVQPVVQAQPGSHSDRSDLGRSGHMGHTSKPDIAGHDFTCANFPNPRNNRVRCFWPRFWYSALLGRCAFFCIWGYFIIALPVLPP